MKKEISTLCKKIAENHHDWEYTADAFKNNQFKHTIKLIDPLWSYSSGSVLVSPIAGVFHKEIEAIHKRIFGFSAYWTHRVKLKDYFDSYGGGGIRIYDIEADNAESRIHKFISEGIELLNKIYDFSSENSLLNSIPEDIEGADGVKYCLIRAYLGDFDYVHRYLEDKITTIRPKKISKIEMITEYFNMP